MTTRISKETEDRVTRLWSDIVDSIAAGETIGDILEAAGLSRKVMYAYMDTRPECRAQWNQAKIDSAEVYVEKVAEIANSPGPDSNVARVRADLYKWLAGKRNPREYSDKTTLDVNVKTLDLTRIISEANARLEMRDKGRLIEHQAAALPRAASDVITAHVLREGVGARESERHDTGGTGG